MTAGHRILLPGKSWAYFPDSEANYWTFSCKWVAVTDVLNEYPRALLRGTKSPPPPHPRRNVVENNWKHILWQVQFLPRYCGIRNNWTKSNRRHKVCSGPIRNCVNGMSNYCTECWFFSSSETSMSAYSNTRYKNVEYWNLKTPWLKTWKTTLWLLIQSNETFTFIIYLWDILLLDTAEVHDDDHLQWWRWLWHLDVFLLGSYCGYLGPDIRTAGCVYDCPCCHQIGRCFD